MAPRKKKEEVVEIVQEIQEEVKQESTPPTVSKTTKKEKTVKTVKEEVTAPSVSKTAKKGKVFIENTNELSLESTKEIEKIDVKEIKNYVGKNLNVGTDETVEINVIKKEDISPRKAAKNKEISIPIKVDRFSPHVAMGLSPAQIQQRNEEGLNNKSGNKYSKSYWEIFGKNIFTFFNLLLMIIAVALIVVGAYTDLFFVVIMVMNTSIGLFQEVKAKKTIDKLTLITAPTAEVIRDSVTFEIPTDQLVLDDIMLLKTGRQISSDAIVKQGAIEVNESLLTGESLPIKKMPGDLVLSGSFVVSGSCITQIEKVGKSNYASTLQEKAKIYKKTKSDLLRSLNLIIRVVACIIVPVGIAMFFNNYWATTLPGVDRIQNAITKTAGSIVGMIPSGMFLLSSFALAIGVIRLAKRKTSVQELYCIEMLARVNVLCLDKTGTLTDGTMQVEDTLLLNTEIDDLATVMGSYLGCFEENNQTSVALVNKFPLNNFYRQQAKIPFSSSRKFSAVSFTDIGTFILGAPEFIYRGQNRKIIDMINKKEEMGYRTIMLGHSSKIIVDDKIEGEVTPVALFTLSDHIRDDAASTIKWFTENDVEVKVISGDNPLTVAQIAKNCGVPHADKYISLAGLGMQEVADIADKYAVFGRVSPEQKAVIVETLHNRRKTVAMTGDGVNDILALKQADCSIAMASGSEAARNVSHLVLLDSNFASMPRVVEEGRRVINNIQKTSALFLIKTIFTILLSLGTLIASLFGLNFSYLFTPKNFMIWEMCAIGIPSSLLTLETNKMRIKGDFLKNVVYKAFPGSIVFLGYICLVFLLKQIPELGITDSNMVSLCVVGMSAIGMVILYDLCRPVSPFRIALVGSMIICTIIGIFIVPKEMTGINYMLLNPVNWLLIGGVICGSLPFYRFTDSAFKILRE